MYPGIQQYAALASLYGGGPTATPEGAVGITPTHSPVLPSFGPTYVNTGQAITPTQGQPQEQAAVQPQAQAAVTPQDTWIDALNRRNAYQQMNGVGSASYFGDGGKGLEGTPAWDDLQKIRAVNPHFGFESPSYDGGF